MRLDHLGCVGKHDADRVASSNAELLEYGSQPCGTIPALGPSKTSITMNHGGHFAEDFGTSLNETRWRKRREVGAVSIKSLLIDAHRYTPGSKQVQIGQAVAAPLQSARRS
ncbi:hypothetical protein ACINB_33780 [Acidovorax sp. NB1]|nr:hypothetical protein ACINB_33780 [Acidovorax sp. NB1]